MSDELTSDRILQQFMGIFILPAIQSRQQAGTLPESFVLLAAQVIFHADDRSTEVRLNGIFTGLCVYTNQFSFIYKQRYIYCCTSFHGCGFQRSCCGITFYAGFAISYFYYYLIRKFYAHWLV